MINSRCTWRKHVIENGSRFCDCEAVILNPTAGKNAQIVTLLATRLISELRKEGDDEPAREIPSTESQTSE